MNKVKRVKNDNYTTISNVFLRDKKLSMKAKGLLATVLSLPEDWDFSIKGICAIIKEGTTAIYSAIDELKINGYCTVETLRDERGRVIGNDYTFYENPHLENPNMDNQSQINKEVNNNNIPNAIYTSIKEEKKENKKESEDLFEKCWIAYRRKGVKKKSLEYWKKLTDTEKQSVLPHVKAYVSSRDIQYQKDFERYLRDKVFMTVVFVNNNVVYDPTLHERGAYTPQGKTIWFNKDDNSYWSTELYYELGVSDGYTDDDRPDGAMLTLNNGRGKIKWSAETKMWNKE